MNRSTSLWATVVAALVVAASCEAPPTATAPPNPVDRTIGFESPEKLTEHYRKHGAEFGARSKAEYLRLAQNERDARVDDNVLQNMRSDGVTTRFDKRTGGFCAFNPDRTIRTFFRPNDGEAYYWRQLNR